jgi:hypothetical protein
MLKRFKKVPNHKGIFCNPEGQIFSIASERILTQHDSGKGYLKVGFYKNGTLVNRYVHYLVCLTFNKKKKFHNVVRHKNGIKKDNRKSNLVWGTQKQNMLDKRLHHYNEAIFDCIVRLKKRGANENLILSVKSLLRKVPI